MAKFKMHVQVEIRDKNGKLIGKTQKTFCHSYVLQFIDCLKAFMGSSNDSILDTSNSTFTIGGAGYPWFCAVAAVGDALFGIVAGTGTDAVLITDYKLKTKIAHGNSATQLSHGSCSVGACATVGSTRKYTIARTFTNNSGENINVKEVGLYLKVLTSIGGIRYVMGERTLLDFVIANGTSGTVTYTISVTV